MPSASSHDTRDKARLPELLPPPSFYSKEASEQSYSVHSYFSSPSYNSLPPLQGSSQSEYREPPRPHPDFIPPPPVPPKLKAVEYHPSKEYEGTSQALVRRPYASAIAARSDLPAPAEHRIIQQSDLGCFTPGLPTQITFIAAHHCAACGQPRSQSYHKDNPLIPGQIAAPDVCRKCAKKLVVGQPIDTIVLPMCDYESKNQERSRRKGRHERQRSSSRTRITIRYGSRDRACEPERDESPDHAKRGRRISYRHVSSCDHSKAPAPEYEERRQERRKQASPARRSLPPLPRKKTEQPKHNSYYEEEELITTARTGYRSSSSSHQNNSHRDRGQQHSPDERGGNHELDEQPELQRHSELPPRQQREPKEYRGSTRVQLDSEHVKFDAQPIRTLSKKEPASRKDDRPPMSYRYAEPRRHILHSQPPSKPAKENKQVTSSYLSAHTPIASGNSWSDRYRERDLRATQCSLSPEQRKPTSHSRSLSETISSMASRLKPASNKTTESDHPKGSQPRYPDQINASSAHGSDYTRYRDYHSQPPSPPTVHSTSPPPPLPRPRLVSAPYDARVSAQKKSSSMFHTNPNPGASKQYSDRSVRGSTRLPSHVTFTESEITSVNGVRIADERTRRREVHEVQIGGGERRSRSGERRRERMETFPPPAEAEPITYRSGYL